MSSRRPQEGGHSRDCLRITDDALTGNSLYIYGRVRWRRRTPPGSRVRIGSATGWSATERVPKTRLAYGLVRWLVYQSYFVTAGETRGPAVDAGMMVSRHQRATILVAKIRRNTTGTYICPIGCRCASIANWSLQYWLRVPRQFTLLIPTYLISILPSHESKRWLSRRKYERGPDLRPPRVVFCLSRAYNVLRTTESKTTIMQIH